MPQEAVWSGIIRWEMNVLATTKKSVDVLSFVQVTPPQLRERTPENDALRVFETAVASQIVSQILEAIATGRLAPGTPLPSHQDLSKHWFVHRNTVTDAFKLLRSAYAIEGDREGTFVTSDPSRVRRLVARERLSSAMRFALSMDMRPDDVAEELNSLLDAWKDRRSEPRRKQPLKVVGDKRALRGRRAQDHD